MVQNLNIYFICVMIMIFLINYFISISYFFIKKTEPWEGRASNNRVKDSQLTTEQKAAWLWLGLGT